MASIIKGTTPTFRFTFKDVDPSNVTVAYLTIKQNKELLVQRDLTTAIVNPTEHTIAYKLTQPETLLFNKGKIMVMHNWLLMDGTRGASPEAEIQVLDNHKDEVIG